MNKRPSRVTTRLLTRRLQALKRHLPQAVAGDDRGVHQARVATRRLREAVPVLATGLKHSKAGKARRKIRRLTRALGAVRELDVTLGLLDELAAAEQVPRAAVEDVRAHVISERDHRREVMLERLEKVDAEKLERRLLSVAEALEGAEHEQWRAALAARLLKRGRRLAAAMTEAGQMYAPEQLHAVRIAAKTLRYGLELAHEAGAAAAGPHVRAIKRAQDVLGALHDLQILQRHVAEVQASAAPRADMRVSLEALAQHIEAECRHLHARYLVMTPDLRATCAAVVEIAGQELSPARRRKTAKMSLPKPAAAAQGGR
jgi:CHAD domain-containing protein